MFRQNMRCKSIPTKTYALALVDFVLFPISITSQVWESTLLVTENDGDINFPRKVTTVCGSRFDYFNGRKFDFFGHKGSGSYVIDDSKPLLLNTTFSKKIRFYWVFFPFFGKTFSHNQNTIKNPHAAVTLRGN